MPKSSLFFLQLSQLEDDEAVVGVSCSSNAPGVTGSCSVDRGDGSEPEGDGELDVPKEEELLCRPVVW